MALRVGSSYRTVSLQVIQVVCGITPIHLMVDERVRIHNLGHTPTDMERAAERTVTYGKWQQEWSLLDKWTNKLPPHIMEWTNIGCKDVDYFTIQALTGHRTWLIQELYP
ncbi:uncharacterized protein [Leptinotarsa decemlineata]|uniref:uncharacterized protein n=1 Tax=Leptinotarsa decemlineata TaxID=7539 RepID=UPI003D304B26